MQQLMFEGPGTLAWRDQSPPTLQHREEVLVRPLVVAACDLDRQIVRGLAPFAPPFPLGHEFVAEVIAADGAQSWRPGEVVAVAYQPSCGTCRACRRGITSACERVPKTSMYGLGPAAGDWGGALSDCVRVPFPDAMLCRLPTGVTALQAANASDNLLDAFRCVAPPLAAHPGGSVLVAGSGAISLFAVDCARRLGSERVSYYSPDRTHLERAETLGAEAHEVQSWPERFPTHDITVDCTNEPRGLYALVASTAAGGFCTSPPMYFVDVALPMQRMCMKGITFCTGRTNGAAGLPRMLQEIAQGHLDPLAIGPEVVPWESAAEALLGSAPKVIIDRSSTLASSQPDKESSRS